MSNLFQATVNYRAEKPHGVGRTAHERHSHIVPGWRGEIIDGLPEGRFVYTGVCATRDECKVELTSHLKCLGYHGILRIV